MGVGIICNTLQPKVSFFTRENDGIWSENHFYHLNGAATVSVCPLDSQVIFRQSHPRNSETLLIAQLGYLHLHVRFKATDSPSVLEVLEIGFIEKLVKRILSGECYIVSTPSLPISIIS